MTLATVSTLVLIAVVADSRSTSRSFVAARSGWRPRDG
jgi:hypothetical protein